ncbi:MAG: U4/U6-U5 snRNP complex subunit lsm6 [Chrysothrix sp. TS-e1954]|nr:MAG: U4/U6-U5 snRNP complex subunit lsm6 [Chrysothrix sp. TS-e1954]
MENGTPAPSGGPGTSSAADPSSFLSAIIGAPVTVKLNSGISYKGTHVSLRLAICTLIDRGWVGELQSVDGYMNIALEQTKEMVDGRVRRTYGDAFVRGNNGESRARDGSEKQTLWGNLTMDEIGPSLSAWPC